MKKRMTVVDPPNGWLYGFPKVMPNEVMNDAEFSEWLMQQGYPPSLVDQALHHSRYWDVDAPESAGEGH